NLAVAKIIHILGDDIRKISIGLDAIEKFSVALSVEGARLVRDTGRSLPFFPLASVDDQHLVPLIRLNSPDTNYTQKRLWLLANPVIGKVDFERLCCGSKQQRREEAGGCHRKSSDVFGDYHSWPPFFLTNCAGMCGARRLDHHATAINNGRATKNQGSAIH